MCVIIPETLIFLIPLPFTGKRKTELVPRSGAKLLS